MKTVKIRRKVATTVGNPTTVGHSEIHAVVIIETGAVEVGISVGLPVVVATLPVPERELGIKVEAAVNRCEVIIPEVADFWGNLSP